MLNRKALKARCDESSKEHEGVNQKIDLALSRVDDLLKRLKQEAERRAAIRALAVAK